MLIGMNDLAEHTSEWLRQLRSADEGLLVTRRNKQLLVSITPARGARKALEFPVRQLSRATYSVIKEVIVKGEAATITSRGTPIAEINPVSPEEERRDAAAVAVQSKEFMDSLRRADEDLAAGRAVVLDDALIKTLPKERGRRRHAGANARRPSRSSQA
jgi:antitoxin (DNA-binding transcriptional repressor) of toxin-antitoxin stability system